MSYIALHLQFVMIDLPLDKDKKPPCIGGSFYGEPSQRREDDLMSLLSAEQKGVLQLSVQIEVNLENQETLCPASQCFVAAQSKDGEDLDCLCEL